MSAFVDMSCRKCGRRYGYQGSVTEPPPCPSCGFSVPQEELQEAARKMELHRKMRETPHHFKPLEKAKRYCSECGQNLSAEVHLP